MDPEIDKAGDVRVHDYAVQDTIMVSTFTDINLIAFEEPENQEK